MKHIDLFSGIGGFALAVDTVWPHSEHIFCDNDPFCQEVIKKHWPNSKIYGDIRTLTNTDSLGFSTRRLEINLGIESKKMGRQKSELTQTTENNNPFILTGGFPCQPFSQAGRRKGTADDRHLWPEMLRVIREFRPEWVIGENVAGLLTIEQGMVFEQVCLDLEAEGYEVQPFIIPAVAVNAPHRRDRVWIIAENTLGERSRRGMEGGRQILECQSSEVKNERPSWERNWIEVATELCRVDDGLPKRLDRNPRLKALGNAIVPQVAIEIMKGIKSLTPLEQV